MMDPALKKLEAMAGLPKMLFAFSMPMTSAARDTRRMKGNMMRVSSAVNRAFSGIEARGNERHELMREHHAERAEHSQHQDGESGHLVREPPRRRISFARDRLAEGGDERGRQRSLGEQISQQIRDPERGREGVHRRRAE